jgi:hypothetical protein
MKRKRIILGSVLIIFLLIVLFVTISQLRKRVDEREELVLLSSEVDENGLYYAGAHAFKAMENFDETYINQMSSKLNKAYDTLLNSDMKVYYSVIPDKGYFIENDSFSKDNYQSMLQILKDGVEHMEYIPIFDKLSIEDYYKTDHHWRQEKLFPVVKQLGKQMDFKINKDLFEENIVQDYKGVYSEYMQDNQTETFIYLTSKTTDEAKVSAFEGEEHKGVYFLEQLESDVPYNMFLNGPSPLVTIKNLGAGNERELIIFGDSFASSLTPLLLEAYSKITLIDMRFVPTSYLIEILEFKTQDVLFLYNTAVINRSAMLRFD